MASPGDPAAPAAKSGGQFRSGGHNNAAHRGFFGLPGSSINA